jgi:hypothetical protein
MSIRIPRPTSADLTPVDASDSPVAAITHEVERLKRRIVWIERAGSDRWRRISFLYRVADRFSSRVLAHSFCHGEMRPSIGCTTGRCCQCRPDVFAYEREVLELLPKRVDDTGYCPFFNLARRSCGIYGVRPFACRIYYNFTSSGHYCQNPNDEMLQLFDNLKPHLEKVLGPYRGGYGG